MYEQVKANSGKRCDYDRHLEELVSHFDVDGQSGQINKRTRNPKDVLDQNIAIRRDLESLEAMEGVGRTTEAFKLPNFSRITKKDIKREQYTQNLVSLTDEQKADRDELRKQREKATYSTHRDIVIIPNQQGMYPYVTYRQDYSGVQVDISQTPDQDYSGLFKAVPAKFMEPLPQETSTPDLLSEQRPKHYKSFITQKNYLRLTKNTDIKKNWSRSNSNLLMKIGRVDEALPYTEERLRLYKQLAPIKPVSLLSVTPIQPQKQFGSGTRKLHSGIHDEEVSGKARVLHKARINFVD